MTPADAKTVANFLLATLEYEVPTTARVFAAVPPDRADYRPDSVSKNALELIRHIALEDVWFLNGVADGQFGPMPDQTDACGLMKPDDAVAQYAPRMAAAIARVRAASGEQLLREVDLMGAFKLPAIQFLSLALRHSTHHRGQLSAYLRAMGSKVPSIYGPSADTAMAV
jgi:uncharacterized damage-inducible protein DinB